MMDNTTLPPAGPEIAGLAWRAIHRADLPALHALAQTCLRVDGGLGFLFEADFLLERYFPDEPETAIGAFSPDGSLAACASVYIEEGETQQATIVGLVHPDFRLRGIGAYMMRWSKTQAGTLLADVPEDQRKLLIRTESLIEAADHLYRAYGFERTFDELVMRRDLLQPLPERAFPADIAISTWGPAVRQQFFEAYEAAFRERPGFPGWSAEKWIGDQEGNDLVIEWTLLALADGQTAGFVIGDIDLTAAPPNGYIFQVGVVPSQRRRGLASALLVESMRRMQAAGAPAAVLTVHTNNPGAIEAYARLGFETIGQRARYERAVKGGMP